jgi:hypothetical protein
VVEVIAEDDMVAVERLLGRERKGDRVTVVGVLWGGKIGRGFWGILGEA